VISGERKKALAAFQRSAKIRFKNLELLDLAFVHRSVSNESGSRPNNERLEFLGDSVLGLVTAALLYESMSGKNEGELAKIKSVVVSEDILSGIARELQIDKLLVLGHGEECTGGRTKKALLADALEALFGAVYLDCGYKTASAFISRLLKPEIARVVEKRFINDYKSLLQEECQKRFKVYPAYKLLKRSGPEHERFFWIEVAINGKTYGPGMGTNKKSAEQEAAKTACKSLEITAGAEM
jgi:ribonuclease-3